MEYDFSEAALNLQTVEYKNVNYEIIRDLIKSAQGHAIEADVSFRIHYMPYNDSSSGFRTVMIEFYRKTND